MSINSYTNVGYESSDSSDSDYETEQMSIASDYHFIPEVERPKEYVRKKRTCLIENIDPRGRPTVTTDSDHCFHMWCPSVPTFQNLERQNNFK